MSNKLSLSRIFIGTLVGLFLVIVITLATQAQEQPADVNTLMGLKTPPSAFFSWQPVSCATENNCESKVYQIRTANSPELLNEEINPYLNDVVIYYSYSSYFTHEDVINDGINYYYSVYALCAENNGTPRGCSHGFWKNHPDQWVGYSPNTTLGSIFNFSGPLNYLASNSLMDALNFHGGGGADGAARLLLMQASAALLNSSKPELDFYPICKVDLINSVNATLATLNPNAMLSLKNTLDCYNNLACSL